MMRLLNSQNNREAGGKSGRGKGGQVGAGSTRPEVHAGVSALQRGDESGAHEGKGGKGGNGEARHRKGDSNVPSLNGQFTGLIPGVVLPAVGGKAKGHKVGKAITGDFARVLTQGTDGPGTLTVISIMVGAVATLMIYRARYSATPSPSAAVRHSSGGS